MKVLCTLPLCLLLPSLHCSVHPLISPGLLVDCLLPISFSIKLSGKFRTEIGCTAWWHHDLGHSQRRYLRQAGFMHNSNTARQHYLMDSCQYAISLSKFWHAYGQVAILYHVKNILQSAVACAQLGIWDYSVQCCRWKLAYGGAVGFTSCKYLATVQITNGFILWVPNVYDGATYNYWRHMLCSHRRRCLLTKYILIQLPIKTSRLIRTLDSN
ncbi:hypothetical protein ARMGADRAFT_1034519 [Armillaria gallica]|uniref:Secreted protein n=1 Tax=Armillaria gallica TaxID=47427 RepID=A0A2H3CXZ5_ARMGA|nr:hypothetical protein ARMGADRAFT_1034519 [Armillaria gallica]